MLESQCAARLPAGGAVTGWHFSAQIPRRDECELIVEQMSHFIICVAEAGVEDMTLPHWPHCCPLAPSDQGSHDLLPRPTE